jgi:pimeloyl-ACP methyl ester carboxylesterase
MQRFLEDREQWFPCGASRMRYIRLPARQAATPARPALVLVHGLLGYSFSWRHNLEFLSRDRDVYAVDLLGIGQSDRPSPAQADYGLPAAAARVLALVRSLPHTQVDLVGTSHGGAVVMLAAALDRKSSLPVIRRLALIAPAHPFMHSARFRLWFFRTRLGAFLLRGIIHRSGLLRRMSMGAMYAHASRITAATRAGYDVNLGDPTSYTYVLAVVQGWRAGMEALRAALPSIRELPALLLWGDRDRAVAPSSAPPLQACFAHSRLVIVHDCGHLPYEECPARFNHELSAFLDSESPTL